MKRWDLNLSRDCAPGTATVMWTFESPAGVWKHDLSMNAPTEAYPAAAVQVELMSRALCHAMIDILPATLLVDVLESLSDSYRTFIMRQSGPRRIAPSTQATPLRGRLAKAERSKPLSFTEQP